MCDDDNQLAWFVQQEADWQEEEADDLLLEAATVTVSLLLNGAEESWLRWVEQQHKTRQYLVRSELILDPQGKTPWQTLYQNRSDWAFITTMGFNVITFNYILESGFAQTWVSTPIPCRDTSIHGDPRPSARSLGPEGALGLVLHYLNSTMLEVSLQLVFALIPSTVSRYITFGLSILLETLRYIADAWISWLWNLEEFEHCTELISARHPCLHGAFVSIDGLNLALQTSEDEEIENATFNGWLQEHFVSSVLVFSPDGTIIAARTNAPGSWHDARVAQPIYDKLRDRTPDGFYLVADTAFPRGTGTIKGHIRAPVKAGQWLQGTREEIDEAMAFDWELLSFRQTAEWGNHFLQGTFGRLRVPLEVQNAERWGDLLEIPI